METHEISDCPMDGCAGSVDTPDKQADKDAYWSQPKPASTAAFRKVIEESGKGYFVDLSQCDREPPP